MILLPHFESMSIYHPEKCECPPPSEPTPHTIEGLKYHSENKIFISMKKMPLFSSIIKKCESHNKTSTSTIFKYATGLIWWFTLSTNEEKVKGEGWLTGLSRYNE